MPRRPILLALAIAAVVTGRRRAAGRGQPGRPEGRHRRARAGRSSGRRSTARPFDLAALRGRPVIVNFWGPSCVPCRDEFPQFLAKLAEHQADGLAIVGVLTDDPEQPARDFIAEYGATWPTVVDPDKSIKTAYRVAARPQTYFVDAQGILRSIQIGQANDADFERQYAQIAP